MTQIAETGRLQLWPECWVALLTGVEIIVCFSSNMIKAGLLGLRNVSRRRDALVALTTRWVWRFLAYNWSWSRRNGSLDSPPPSFKSLDSDIFCSELSDILDRMSKSWGKRPLFVFTLLSIGLERKCLLIMLKPARKHVHIDRRNAASA